MMDRIKNSRAVSFLMIALVYAGAAAFGIAIYNALDLSFQLALLIADFAATGFVFVFSLIFSNASVYDPYWSVQPVVILWAAAAAKGFNAAGLLAMIAVTFWGIRLTANWAYTFKNLNSQDWRYTMLKEKTGRLYPSVNLLGIHLFPTLVVYACTLPALYLFEEGAHVGIDSILCIMISFGAVLLQGTADYQMHVFRKKGRGGLIRTGLWKYARHPNYLGEILMWWGIGLYSVLSMGAHFLLLWGALLNTLMFLFISVPLAEGRQSEKPGFEEYKEQTRMFI
ncbi:MAG: DUF1295 domain-containing protein [Lachnospiraceae bacterium]|nr:DUF1295 domain-containing protein [Lachnospiraceae bacterium]